ncbi:MAG: cyclic nucleotide-binding domain-containing protein [Lacipirellulaceae bacterium]
MPTTTATAAVAMPKRWDAPFSPAMTSAVVERLRRIEPFVRMDPAAFPTATPLDGILRNDTRVVRYAPAELVVREGDYGGSAFLVLDGTLRVAIDPLGAEATGRGERKRVGLLGKFVARLLQRDAGVERLAKGQAPVAAAQGVFLQDVPSVLGRTRTARLLPGELFGELAALTRSPRSASVFTETPVVLLEVRWQGLRDLMRWGPALRDHVERLYRQNSLRVHLRETPLLASLDDAALARVAAAIEFTTYGSFDWRDDDHDETLVRDSYQRSLREPLIVEAGQPIEGLLLVRSGFARVAEPFGASERTTAYVGKGAVLGGEELLAAHGRGDAPVWRRTLRGVGYVDVLKLPAPVFFVEVAPRLSESERRWLATTTGVEGDASERSRRLDFLVDRRFVNGAEAMVIDLDRCTRCDDCVRACAATHDGNPRFIRQGPTLDHYQFAHACMHCADPVCMIGCPTGAIHRDPESGVVRINDATCIGCTVCAEACPYDNIQMVELRQSLGGIAIDETTGRPLLRATKCDLCVDEWSGPACQHACPHDALVRIDLTDPTSLARWGDR